MVMWLIKKLFVRGSSQPFMAIKAKNINNSRIEDNKCTNAGLISAENINQTQIRRNRIDQTPQKLSQVFVVILDVFVGLIVAFIVYKFGWN